MLQFLQKKQEKQPTELVGITSSNQMNWYKV